MTDSETILDATESPITADAIARAIESVCARDRHHDQRGKPYRMVVKLPSNDDLLIKIVVDAPKSSDSDHPYWSDEVLIRSRDETLESNLKTALTYLETIGQPMESGKKLLADAEKRAKRAKYAPRVSYHRDYHTQPKPIPFTSAIESTIEVVQKEPPLPPVAEVKTETPGIPVEPNAEAVAPKTEGHHKITVLPDSSAKQNDAQTLQEVEQFLSNVPADSRILLKMKPQQERHTLILQSGKAQSAMPGTLTITITQKNASFTSNEKVQRSFKFGEAVTPVRGGGFQTNT